MLAAAGLSIRERAFGLSAAGAGFGGDDEVSQSIQDAGDATSSRRRRKIIIVDDSELVLSATSEILRRAGYKVLTRNGPSGCVAMILQEKPDLVLLDVGMPAVSGDTIVKLLGTAAPNSSTVLLLFSGMDEDVLKAKAKACGAHGYVAKTYNPAVLLRTVNHWLRRPLGQGLLALTAAGLPKTAGISGEMRTPLQSRSSGEVRIPDQVRASGEMRVPAYPNISGEMRVPAYPRLSGELKRPDPFASSEEPRGAMGPRFSGEMPIPTLAGVSGEMRISRASSAYSEEGPRVLFVDDDMLVLSGYRRQLHGQPIHFEFALSGGEALRRLLSPDPPSLIVADLVMPVPGGAEVFRRAVEHDSSWNRRFVIVTGMPLSDARKQIDSRFSGFMFQKPVMSDALSAAIRDALGVQPLQPAVSRARVV